jgi:hypothetical protein
MCLISPGRDFCDQLVMIGVRRVSDPNIVFQAMWSAAKAWFVPQA